MKYRHHLHNDRWPVELVFPGLRGGYFVEAGACGGKYQSATWVLETELEWQGICVEPEPEHYEQLVRTRHCRTDDRCLWGRTGETVPFQVIGGDRARSGIAETMNNPESLRLAEVCTQTVSKQTITMHDLLATHGAPQTVHYIGVDIEGAERAVLEAFDFSESPYRVLALSIEGDRCDDLMGDAGYLRARNPFTEEQYEHYFLHPELASKASDPERIG